MSKATWFFVVVILLMGGVIVYNKVLTPQEEKGKAAHSGPPKDMSVNGFLVQPKTLNSNITASGTLLAFEEVELHTETSGRITELNLKEGTPVSKGTLLVKLYDADLQAQLGKLKLQQETAEKTVGRLQQLLAINGIGQQDFDNAVTQLNNIKADIDVVLAQITKTEIRAPFNGVVGLRNVSAGAYVSPSVAIATLQQIDPLKIDFTVPEKYASSVKKDDGIQFAVDGFDGTFHGKVYAIEPKIDEDTRTIRMRALVQNTNAKLFPGGFAKVDLGLKSMDNALMIPTQCIIPEARNKKVIVVKDGKADFRIVETGVRNESDVQITKGLEAGDTVVTTGVMYLKPGGGVKIAKLTE